ncbi:ATP-binding cassette domain-containing protein [Umezawaea sp. Da 62-37]|uniref:ABC transporter ATP-binding protein n=1 Tax=Umezawaea sp. Da 62-37 TaxID=3075927 RepID=UPI0028F6C9D0|nr:ATP-binding cassette domain-containing protein [Umezawaea sp. Da 62-37]WNV85796.1 ATP-binding cassette domain-containing protein [Umezawaea sp. Da 62-37]
MFGLTASPHRAPVEESAVRQEGHRVLRGVDLTIRAGETVAVVGESGAGKSTIAMLAAGLSAPTGGVVEVHGRDTREIALHDLARTVAFISQDTHVRHDSIAENLRYVRPSATDADVERACRAAQLHRLVESLPDGYDTVIGEKGHRFSGGERQRLSIARALLKDADLVLLDEPTSQLDAGTEDLLTASLAELFADKAVLLMAHRLRTVRDADRILVLSGGVIKENGTHDELLVVPGGQYASLYGKQVHPTAKGGS